MKKLAIDLLEGKELLGKTIINSDSYIFYNFIEYAKEKYNFSVVDLSTLFNCTRQTLYNYLNDTTENLKDKVKEKIAEIYNVVDIVEAVNKELNLLRLEYIKLKIEDVYKKKGKIDSIPNQDKKFFDIKIDNNQFNIEIKKEFLTINNWNDAISKAKKLERLSMKSKLINQLVLYLSNNSENYNIKLIDLLSKYENNDQELLINLNNGLENNLNSGVYGRFINDPKEIKEKIDKILNKKNMILSLDEEDFIKMPKCYIGYTINKSKEFNPKLDIYDIDNYENVIVNVTSYEHLSLYDIDQIIVGLNQKLDKSTNIIFGSCIDKEEKQIKIDIFIIK